MRGVEEDEEDLEGFLEGLLGVVHVAQVAVEQPEVVEELGLGERVLLP